MMNFWLDCLPQAPRRAQMLRHGVRLRASFLPALEAAALGPLNFIRARLVAQGVVSIHEAHDMSPGEVRAVVGRGLLHVSRTVEECDAARSAYARCA